MLKNVGIYCVKLEIKSRAADGGGERWWGKGRADLEGADEDLRRDRN